MNVINADKTVLLVNEISDLFNINCFPIIYIFYVLVDAAELEPIKSYFSSLMEYEFGPKIDDGIIKANKALKKFSKGDMNISAYLQVASIEEIMINEEHITIHTKLSGKVNANIGL